MKKVRVIGFVLLLVGIIFVLDSQVGITGFVVAENLGSNIGTLIGMVLFIGGIGLLAYEHSQANFGKSIKLLVDMYDSGRIDSMQTAERINQLRAGHQIKGLKYVGGLATIINTRRGDVPIRVSNQDKALDLVSALYWVALVNDRDNMKNLQIEIDPEKMPKLGRIKGGLTGYLKAYSEKNKDDLQRLART